MSWGPDDSLDLDLAKPVNTCPHGTPIGQNSANTMQICLFCPLTLEITITFRSLQRSAQKLRAVNARRRDIKFVIESLTEASIIYDALIAERSGDMWGAYSDAQKAIAEEEHGLDTHPGCPITDPVVLKKFDTLLKQNDDEISRLEDEIRGLQRVPLCGNHKRRRMWWGVSPCKNCHLMHDEYQRTVAQKGKIPAMEARINALRQNSRYNKALRDNVCPENHPDQCASCCSVARTFDTIVTIRAQAENQLTWQLHDLRQIDPPKKLVKAVLELVRLARSEPGGWVPGDRHSESKPIVPASPCACARADCRGPHTH
jgi:hypothetical protein